MAKKAKQKVEPKKQNNLILIYGNQYSVDETIKRLKEQVQFDEVEKIDGESIDATGLANLICNDDIFASKKLILIQEVPKEDAEKLTVLFPRISSSNCVVFYSYSL